ncbi:(2Fe-2S)-binding protein [Knoellia sp. p5-6-4]|uniref:(2Fe-2S)-binding protein n=1 Tax=unclassified Knoellia TaxID=2618719 RepID=UPI0023DB0139|nr:(2Fe-2S)-binding protein [Knoellia sp. p5-6-4]MDF2144608.1 (2Fe-2S)-binding protein [Knoellia sp. p5-6-4]
MAGEDPTGPWREALAASTARQHGRPTPPAMPAAFVLQWVLEVPATVAAYAVVLGPWDPDLSGASLSFDLSPQLFPAHLQIRAARPGSGEGEARLAAARTAYEGLARPFAATYEPGVRLGPHQRQAMVDDVWAMALHRAHQAVAERPARPPQRQSCCFIYALPGAHECAGCPRLSR